MVGLMLIRELFQQSFRIIVTERGILWPLNFWLSLIMILV